MSKASVKARRESVERNIYRRADGTLEVGYRDGSGKQRWVTVDGGIKAARRVRDDLLARRGRGERVTPNGRLRFGEAADHWLTNYVPGLRDATQTVYRVQVERHLRPRFGAVRLDAITSERVAALGRELRAAGLSESSAAKAVAVLNMVYKWATRRMNYHGPNPLASLLRGERPRAVSETRRRPFTLDESRAVIAASAEPWRTIFALAMTTCARQSEVLGLTWEDVDVKAARVTFAAQVDRKGNRAPTKTDGSVRTVPIPSELAAMLARHKLAADDTSPAAFVFATATGRPIGQRNTARALRATMKRAVDGEGRAVFTELHERDENGRSVAVPRGVLPSMHSFRHTAVSVALAEGDSLDEIAYLVGHRDGTVTRQVYAHEFEDARREALRRSAMAQRFGSILDAGPAVEAPGGTATALGV